MGRSRSTVPASTTRLRQTARPTRATARRGRSRRCADQNYRREEVQSSASGSWPPDNAPDIVIVCESGQTSSLHRRAGRRSSSSLPKPIRLGILNRCLTVLCFASQLQVARSAAAQRVNSPRTFLRLFSWVSSGTNWPPSNRVNVTNRLRGATAQSIIRLVAEETTGHGCPGRRA